MSKSPSQRKASDGNAPMEAPGKVDKYSIENAPLRLVGQQLFMDDVPLAEDGDLLTTAMPQLELRNLQSIPIPNKCLYFAYSKNGYG